LPILFVGIDSFWGKIIYLIRSAQLYLTAQPTSRDNAVNDCTTETDIILD